MYQDLASTKGDNTSALVNLSAAGIAPGFSEGTVRHAQLNAAGEWEILYNKSLALGMEGRLGEAMQVLAAAQKTLSKEEDVEDENWQIELQRAYLLHRLDELQQAKDLYTSILSSPVKDLNVRSVATHNLSVLSETPTPLFDLQKPENKLTILQESALLLNLAIIYSKKHRTQECEDCLRRVEALDLGEKALIIRAWGLMKEKKHAEYEALLRGRGTARSLKLLSAIYIQQKKVAEAAAAFKEVIALTEKKTQIPEQYLTLAGLFDRSGNLPEAISCLQASIVQFPTHKPTIRRLWECLHRNTQYSEAAHYLESYQKQFSGDLDTTSLLVLAEANVDLEAAVKYAAKLPEVNLKALYNREGVIESLDQILDRLESGGAATIRAKPEEMKVDQTEFTRKKRKRKPKYPKGFDPKNPNNPLPDPERWLAKKDRSTYKKTKKQKKEMKMKGPQGEMPSVVGQEHGTFATGPSTKHIEAVVDKTAPKKKSKKKK